MTGNACDYAFSNPTPAGLHAAGILSAGRYVGPGSAGKHLTAAERDALFAAGLTIFLLVEGAADSALGGRSVGVQHGQQALAGARALGAPDTCALYAAVDFDATAAQWPLVAAYFQGYNSVVGLARSGIYGGVRAMQWAARDHLAMWFFQTYAWSAGVWFAGNHVEQYRNGVAMAGGTVDLCRIKQANFGQWRKAGPPTSGGEDEMRIFHLPSGYVVVSDGVTRRHLTGAKAEACITDAWQTTTVQVTPAMLDGRTEEQWMDIACGVDVAELGGGGGKNITLTFPAATGTGTLS